MAGSTSDAVSATSPSVLSWASVVAAYSPGADVTATFQTPNNAVGPYSTSIVSLGNGGSVTLSFDSPIHDGAGNDFAVFENGFMSNPTAEMLFTELAYVEVSSNGTDFVRFDSASRQPNAVGAFDYQDPRLIGGLAGSHISRLKLDNNRVIGEERLLESEGQRFRDIKGASGGALYAVTDEGRLYRLAPTGQ